MKCTVCGDEFEAKRADARFCGSTCRNRAAREVSTVTGKEYGIAVEGSTITESMVSGVTEQQLGEEPVGVKRECKRSSLCCAECIDFESGVHWCPNDECGCWESKAEQEASIKVFQGACDHSSTVMSRCLHCCAVLFTSKADRKGLEALRRFGCGKHNGSFSCGCEESPKKSE
jgi:hypothetical protein